MINKPELQPSRILMFWKSLRWSSFLLSAVASFLVAGRVEARSVRAIQAPAPYNACNVRSAGGIQYSVVGTFRNGTLVTLLGESGRGWYRIQVGQITGWVARQCLGL
ncbi:MAG: SH3 domain-containing protein [Symploca sp. SIO2G7]|nr:SH3 domain-containing protein [Symploca sp. SIO2G7]